jgi:tRNAmet cytidine acetate ligase
MKTVGLITEYNPFHNGHLHHLQESLRQSDADVSIAVMSGHFMQRGEPALVDKWCRAQMALAAGVDVVIELPLPWACSSAPTFADGGVKSLNTLGGINALCFGSESGDLTKLKSYADILHKHNDEIEIKATGLLKRGLTYPQARAQLLTELLPDDVDLQDLSSPNNILGIEYLKSLRQTESHIRPVTITRVGAGYHDSAVKQGQIASATGIRHGLQGGADISEFIPAGAMSALEQDLALGYSGSNNRYFMLLLAQIFRQTNKLSDCWLVENGIENRLLVEADNAADLEQLVVGIKSRQLTRTRIQRMLIAILLGLDKVDTAEQLATGPRYLHLLAVSKKGQGFLAQSRKKRELPLIQNFSRVYASLKRFYGVDSVEYRQALKQLDLELRATRIYSLLMSQHRQEKRNRDFYQPLLRQDSLGS